MKSFSSLSILKATGIKLFPGAQPTLFAKPRASVLGIRALYILAIKIGHRVSTRQP